MVLALEGQRSNVHGNSSPAHDWVTSGARPRRRRQWGPLGIFEAVYVSSRCFLTELWQN